MYQNLRIMLRLFIRKKGFMHGVPYVTVYTVHHMTYGLHIVDTKHPLILFIHTHTCSCHFHSVVARIFTGTPTQV